MSPNRITIAWVLILMTHLAACKLAEVRNSYVWGTLTDKRTNLPLRGITVQMADSRFQAVTDSNGFYLIDRIPSGSYTISFVSSAYQSLIVTPIEIENNMQVRIDHRLEPSWLVVEKRDSISLADRPLDMKYRLEDGEFNLGIQIADSIRPSSSSALSRGGSAGSVLHWGIGYSGGVLGALSSGGSGGSAGIGLLRNYSWPRVSYVYDVQTKSYAPSGFVTTALDSQSTFGADMSTASYSWVRRMMIAADLVASPGLIKSAARPEEFINYFEHRYPSPKENDFGVLADLMPSPFDSARYLLRLGIRTRPLTAAEHKPLSIVLVIDISGSMDWDERMYVVRSSVDYLLRKLDPDDRAALVVYGPDARVVSGFTSNFDSLRRVLKSLEVGGATDVGAGLAVAYRLARDQYSDRHSNNILLCTDGVATKGQTTSKELLETIRKHGRNGIRLTALGFGAYTYNDAGLSELATQGDGQYFYIPHSHEAVRLFEQRRLASIFQTVAEDVVLRATFDPSRVDAYRLIGYEKREVRDKDFGSKQADGAELGPSAEVTALYEVHLTGSEIAPLGRFDMQYRTPGSDSLQQFSATLIPGDAVLRDDLAFTAAVALYADILREHPSASAKSYDDVIRLLESTGTPYRRLQRDYVDFAELVYATKTTWQRKQLQAYRSYWE